MNATKGNWQACEVDGGPDHGGWMEVISESPDNRVNICELFSGHFSMDDGPEYEIKANEVRANAHLIAASPELFTALQECLHTLDAIKAINPALVADNQSEHFGLNVARAALAKATGKG